MHELVSEWHLDSGLTILEKLKLDPYFISYTEIDPCISSYSFREIPDTN